MTHWQLALKRFLRPGTVLLLLLTALTVWAGGSLGHQTQLRPCGVVCEDPNASDIRDALCRKSFVPYETREEMSRAVSRGELDCGAVLLPGLAEAVAAGKPGGHILLLTAPDSFLTEVYEAHLSSTLYAACAPVMAMQAAADAGVTLTEQAVREELDALVRDGYRFTFEITTAAGGAAEPEDLGGTIRLFAAAMLLFAAIVPGTARASEEADRFRSRIGSKKAVSSILIPTLFWQGLLYTLAAGIAQPSQAGALAGYVLLLTALGLISAQLPAKRKILLPICLLGALALYPVYYDLAEAWRGAAALRLVLPPCWMLVIPAHPWSAIALGSCMTAALLLYSERRHP